MALRNEDMTVTLRCDLNLEAAAKKLVEYGDRFVQDWSQWDDIPFEDEDVEWAKQVVGAALGLI